MFDWFGKRWKTSSDGIVRAKNSLLPEETVDVSAAVAAIVATDTAADLDYSTNPLKGIYVGATGTVWIQRVDDSTWFDYDVDKGAYIYGLIAKVGASGSHTTSASMKLRGER